MMRTGGSRKAKKASSPSSKHIDVRSPGEVSSFESLLGKGPLTVVLVYADWCGACTRFKENTWKNVLSMPKRSMNIASVREDMLPKTSLATASVPHYPTLMLVGNDKKPAEFKTPTGETTNAMPNDDKENLMELLNTPVEETMLVSNSVPVESLPLESLNNNANNNKNKSMNALNASTMVAPNVSSDLEETIQNAATVSREPFPKAPLAGGGRVGGLMRALSSVIRRTGITKRRKRSHRRSRSKTNKKRKTSSK